MKWKRSASSVPDIELEVFVHGALCIAYSGALPPLWAILIAEMPIRGPVPTHVVGSISWGNRIQDRRGIRRQISCTTWKRRSVPGEFMPITEDEHGTYIMNSKDLRAVEHVERLVRIGIDSLKIEGRTKSHYYAARSAQVYRQAIDDAVAGHPFNPNLMAELEGLANRGYTRWFLSTPPI